MRHIILGAIGLAIFATPLTAGTPQSDGYAVFEQNSYGVERGARAAGARSTSSERFLVAQAGGRNPDLSRPQNGGGVPYAAPPQGWPLNR